MALRYLILCLFISLSLSGCASLATNGVGFGTGFPTPYAGLQADVEQVSENWDSPPSVGSFTAGTLALVDAPFSAALDTALLPLFLVAALNR